MALVDNLNELLAPVVKASGLLVLRFVWRDFWNYGSVGWRVIKWLVDVGGFNRHVFELLQQNFTVVAKKQDNYSKMS